ncbi:GIY-YIG nuclease family protein [bacterium]|nr:GIY-YIG nuclease family protein [bacterium]
MKQYYVYIMASKRNGTLYIGTTNNLLRRVKEHKDDMCEGFTKKYQVHTLVWYDSTPYHLGAIQREKQMKAWKRKWKLELIEKNNPEWRDLYDELF